MRYKELYTKETNWGTHFVTEGFGKYAGRFIAQSRGAGGARGYFKPCDTLEQAKRIVDRMSAPPKRDDNPIRF